MSIAWSSRGLRLLIALVVAILAVTWSQGATAAERPAAELAPLQRWARTTGVERFELQMAGASRAEVAALGQLVRQPAEAIARDPAFWLAATASRNATESALTARTLALMTQGHWDAAIDHAMLLSTLAPVSPMSLEVLACALAAKGDGPWGSVDAATIADAALDAGDHALAALAYRVAMLATRLPEPSARDLAAPYLYCLHRLGVETAATPAQIRFRKAVLFPSVEAASRARLAAAPHPRKFPRNLPLAGAAGTAEVADVADIADEPAPPPDAAE